MIHWQGLPEEEATWEDYEVVALKFSHFVLEDKKNLEGGGNGGIPPRRSARLWNLTTATANLERMESEEDHDGPLGQVSGLG